VQIERTRIEGYEEVVYGEDPESGLKAFIAIHDTTLGPAIGGCRMWPYADRDAALSDVLRLARSMTYKAAIARLPLGGGKAVIIGDPHKDKTEALMEAFGDFVQGLEGRYITAEEVGIWPDDVETISRRTRYVTGRPRRGGDPTPLAAWGVYCGIRAAVRHKLELSSMAGLSVAVQGLGHVGHKLCRYLHDAGAELIVADKDPEVAAKVAAQFRAEIVAPDAIYSADADVFAPCAMGDVLTDETIPALSASIVAGSANNQLARRELGMELVKRGILYAPDYVISAGGLMKVAEEVVYPGDFDQERLQGRVEGIGLTLTRIFREADREGIDTTTVADRIAMDRLEMAKAA